MSEGRAAGTYGSATIAMHWLMLALFVVAYAAMELKSFTARGSPARENMMLVHYLAGLSVLLLVWLRMIVRARDPVPSIVPAPPAWQESAGRATHWVLYLMMIGLPMLGWLALSATGKPVTVMGVGLPMLLDKNVELSRFLKNLHETAANAGYFVIGLHAAAALFHHYVRHDNTLSRMLPKRLRTRLAGQRN